MHLKLIRTRDTLAKTGVGATTAWRMQQKGLFPSAVRTGPKAVRYLEHEIDAWIAARARGLTDEELRAFVAKMHADRAALGEKDAA
jgi:prophage regulatory protein